MFPLIHLFIMAMTVVVVLGIGIYLARGVRTADAYSVGGRGAGCSLVAGSIAGTVVGGGATVGTAQLAYSFGFSAWWFTLGAGIAFILMGLFYARKLRSTSLETIPEYLYLHYGPWAEFLSSIISSAGILFSAVASCLPGIELISFFLGTEPVVSAMILAALVMAYTFFGGMKSAGAGGILKMGIIAISLTAAGISAWLDLSSGGILASFSSSQLSLMGRGWDASLANLVSVIVGILCTQAYVQCIFSARSPAVASVGCVAAALIVIPVGLPSVAIGMYMYALHPVDVPMMALPLYLFHHVPVFIGGLGMGAIVLSLIGSIGGLSLGIGTMVAKDLVAPIFHVLDDRLLLWIIRASVALIIALACAIAMANRGSQILIWNYLSMSLRGAGVFVPLTMAIFLPGHLKKKWVILSMVGSTVMALLAVVMKTTVDPLFIGLGASFTLLIPGISLKRLSTTPFKGDTL